MAGANQGLERGRSIIAIALAYFIVPFALLLVLAVAGVHLGRALRTRSRQKRRPFRHPPSEQQDPPGR